VAAINIKAFRATTPRTSSRLLQPNQASAAVNCKLTSGRIDPLHAPLAVHTSLQETIRTAYRYRATRLGQPVDNWLVWGEDVDVVPSLIANDPEGRFFFTGDSFDPRMSTYDLAIDSLPYPTAWYALGVFAPTQPPAAAAVGGSGTADTRVYAMTFVTQLGEESPPSPPSAVVSGYQNSTWNLSDLQTAPPNTGTITAATALPDGTVRVTVNTTFGLAQFDAVTFSSVGGMTDLNGSWRIQSIDATNNYVYVALQTSQTYTSGGAWAKDAPHNTTSMTKRLYRTAGVGGVYVFVAEIPAATTTYTDAVAADDLGEELPTADSLPAPRNLDSLVGLPNGCLAGLSGNELCFSDPYLPYSFPTRNRYTFSGRGVALVAAGNSVIVLTDTFPILFTGSDPSAMSPAVMQTYAPCVSKRGVTSVGGGALYPSFDGLWLAAPGRVENQSKALYREDEWALLKPSTFDAAFSDGVYYARFGDASDIPQILAIDVAEPTGVVTFERDATELLRNDYDGRLHIANKNKIYIWDGDDNQRVLGEWTSATIQLPAPTSFAVAQIHAEFVQVAPPDTSVADYNAGIISDLDFVGGALCADEILSLAINASHLQEADPPGERKVQFILYQNGDAVFTREVTSSSSFRLPALSPSEVYNIGIVASVPVYSVSVASSVAELSQVSA
jgi:hypothetical protein